MSIPPSMIPPSMIRPSMPPNLAQMNISVNPTPFVKPIINITNVQVRIVNVVMFTSVDISVALMSDNNAFIDNVQMTLSGKDYTNWGNDDTYLINYALNKLGLSQTTTSS